MATLNNNQIASVLNEAFAMATGTKEIGQLDLQGIIDTGNSSDVIGTKEQFTKALINVLIKNWFTDSSYRSSYFDPFFQDSAKYGAIVQMISIDIPEVEPSIAWQNFTSGQQIGVYKTYMPIIETQYYGKSESWQLAITITGEQWDTAFHSEAEIREFVNYIMLVIDNGLVVHMEDMNNMNRNNFMAEKIKYAKSAEAKGTHLVNLVEVYQKARGGNVAMTANEFYADKEAMKFASERLRVYKKYFNKMNAAFNTSHKKKFTPEDRIVLQVLTRFEENMATVATSDTYHKDIVEMPLYQSVAYWQGTGETFDDDSVSTINVKVDSDGTSIEQSGIVAFMCDQWAIIHTIISERVAAKPFEPENLTNYYFQFRDKYINNLTLNAIVFVVEDYNPTV